MGVLDWGPSGPQQGPQRSHAPQPPAFSIEQLCRASGWVFINQEVDQYRVRSGGPQSNVYIDIRSSERFSNLVFQSWFPIRFSLEKPPAGLFGRVLLRSLDLTWAAWNMSIGQSTEACLCVVARFPAAAMNAGLFRDVCDEIAGEIRAFHQELRDKFSYGMGDVVVDPSQSYRSGVPVRRGEDLPQTYRNGLPVRRGDDLPEIRYVQ